MKLGLHLSISDSICNPIDRAAELGCNIFQMFSRNPRSWNSKRLDSLVVENFKLKISESKIDTIFIHTPYLLNLASPRNEVYFKSVESLKEEFVRAEFLEVPYIVTHLGSHLGHGKKRMLKRVVKAINTVFRRIKTGVILLLENSAGTRNSVGSSFKDIGYVLSSIENQKRVGVCFDTCHAFSAGYDLVTDKSVKNTLNKFDEAIGLDQLKLVHLNDSKGGYASKIDRHQHIGLGMIGMDGFKNILKSKLGKHPLILETPIDKTRDDVGNLRVVKEIIKKLSL